MGFWSSVCVEIFWFVNRAGNLIRTAESEKRDAETWRARAIFFDNPFFAVAVGVLHAERSAKVVYVGSGKCFEGDATNVAG
jgi:hypothetical protein